MNAKILVTGATGKVGRNLISELRARRIDHRAAVHDPKRGGPIEGEHTELVALDFDDAASLRGALDGIETLVRLGSQIFFQGRDGTTGRELFVTDGTSTGTGLFFETNPGSDDGDAANGPAGSAGHM